MKPENQAVFNKYRSSIEHFSEKLHVGDDFRTMAFGAVANTLEEFEAMYVTPRLQESEILRIAAITDYYAELQSHCRESINLLKAVLGIECDGLTESPTEPAESPSSRRAR